MKNKTIAQDLLDILACPMCKTDVKPTEYKLNHQGLQCTKCKKIYPIRDGIPVMLVDEAIDPE